MIRNDEKNNNFIGGVALIHPSVQTLAQHRADRLHQPVPCKEAKTGRPTDKWTQKLLSKKWQDWQGWQHWQGWQGWQDWQDWQVTRELKLYMSRFKIEQMQKLLVQWTLHGVPRIWPSSRKVLQIWSWYPGPKLVTRHRGFEHLWTDWEILNCDKLWIN